MITKLTPKAITAILLAELAACGGGSKRVAAQAEPADDTAAVQQAVDRGGVVTFEARTYHLTKTIVIHQSNVVIQGMGPQTVFEYTPTPISNHVHCVNDRVFTTPCDLNDVPPQRIAQPITIGDMSFVAVGDVSDLQSGEWLLISDRDTVFGDRAAADWVQVDSVDGETVHVRAPFRMAFTTERAWDPGKSGLGFNRITRLIQNTQFRNFQVVVLDAGTSATAAGISVFEALHTNIDSVQVSNPHGQPLYSYISKDVTITNSEGNGQTVLNEFGATVDLDIQNTTFAVSSSAALGLDVGTGFFNVSNNILSKSANIGAYLLYGVHDGTFSNNQVDFVNVVAPVSGANGILAWGVQNATISYNTLAGGAGTSTGISVRSVMSEIEVPAVNVQLIGNVFGNVWTQDYEPGTPH